MQRFEKYKTSISETRSLLTHIRTLYKNSRLYPKITCPNKNYTIQAYCLAVLLKLHTK